MPASVHVLLHSVIDYAGTFPPAQLSLPAAMAAYARAASGPDAAMLGRFVLPASQLEECARLADRSAHTGRSPWPLSVVVGDAALDLSRVTAFDRRPGGAKIRAVEFGPGQAAAIGAVVERIPGGVEAFFELPLDADLEARIDDVARHGALAKVRTGGTVADAVPPAAEVVRFMRACRSSHVAFKATAGLHHAFCGSYPLTYDADSARGRMFGFLNVAVAAALVQADGSPEEATAALGEPSPRAFAFGETGLVWKDRVISLTALGDTRRHLFRSFGSCAFQEPIEELAQLGML